MLLLCIMLSFCLCSADDRHARKMFAPREAPQQMSEQEAKEILDRLAKKGAEKESNDSPPLNVEEEEELLDELDDEQYIKSLDEILMAKSYFAENLPPTNERMFKRQKKDKLDAKEEHMKEVRKMSNLKGKTAAEQRVEIDRLVELQRKKRKTEFR